MLARLESHVSNSLTLEGPFKATLQVIGGRALQARLFVSRK